MGSEEEYFDRVSDIFGADFIEKAPERVANEITTIEQKTTEIQKSIEERLPLMKDQSYIDFELKQLISDTNNILEKLSADIKIGAAPRMYEVFATVVNAKREVLRELINFNKIIMDMTQFVGGDEEEELEEDKTLNVTSSDMLKFFKEIQKESGLNKIDVDFVVEDIT